LRRPPASNEADVWMDESLTVDEDGIERQPKNAFNEQLLDVRKRLTLLQAGFQHSWWVRNFCIGQHPKQVIFVFMAPVKKKSSFSKTRSSSSNGPTVAKVKGENFYRNAKQAARIKMLNGGKPVRDKDGKIIQAAAFQKGEDETKPGRVQPDRRWFGMFLTVERTNFSNLLFPTLGNTRVISQTALDHFRTSLAARKDDPYSVLLRRNKLPMALLDDSMNPNSRKVDSLLSRLAMFSYWFHIHSVLTSLKPNLSATHLVPKLRGNGLE